ncbi:bifunctional precorrin-2 dehydrogenase/sirohydrochlorin ferrochelatase [Mangrovibacterium marinum]|uniref:precorrin-2 dehydrogenase n=1 Tax=Mangrovibacterium marinum TaxID=1639118 RepID=A0A2T5C0D0_9BACT|nr:bifunctional precorrin-2 dehydrogenase/sirohydrochlorin ferrochelatase [Mangrovibacterium marinum]PTN08007.1 precorrin-2 dehydrogenase/sirohydrochlorin ferrochelatase [Mangrovibacterium marinum]
MKRKYLPVSLDITNQKILIVGGGKSAYSKACILKRFDADIEFVALDICPEIKAAGWPYKQQAYQPDDLDGYMLVYSCSNNAKLDCQIRRDAKAKGVLCNIHDKPKMCQYVSPAVYQYKNMTVAVASNGQDVFKSIKLRNHLRDYLNEHIEEILDFSKYGEE